MGKFCAVIRTFRLMRVLRTIRIFKNFPMLNGILKDLADSIERVVRPAVTFALIYVPAILVTTVIGSEAEGFQDDTLMHEGFGTITASMAKLTALPIPLMRHNR